MTKPEFSIVIPTYGHLDDCLKPCLESIIKNTDLRDIEVIVVANGSDEQTKKHVNSLGHPFRLIWEDQPIGYTKATNLGIKAAQAESIVLLNNDVELLDFQAKGEWLRMLRRPFLDTSDAGVTGVAKDFHVGTQSDFLLFFCVMISRRTLDKIGLLDEVFNPGFGEDIDYCRKVRNAGYKVLQVPNDVTLMKMRQAGEHVINFPIYHKGSQTVHEVHGWEDVVSRNEKILAERYRPRTKLNLGCGDQILDGYVNVDLHNPAAQVKADARKLDMFKDGSVEEVCALHVFEHFSPLEAIDILREWYRVLSPGGKLVMELPDILEICKHFEEASKSERYVLLNCIYGTTYIHLCPHLFGWYDEILTDHLAGAGFIDIKKVDTHFKNHWGYNMRMEATKPGSVAKSKNVKYSIIVPTYNHLDDCLRPCLESVKAYTDLSNVEVIVVANGCTDGTRQYVESLGDPFKLIWMDEAQGYIKPTNAGIRAASGQYIVLLNNDVTLLPQNRNAWIDMMAAPFVNPAVGITGPRKSWREDIQNEYILFFCAMIPKALFDKIGLLDEDFGIGYHEDTDFSLRTKAAGYRMVQVPIDFDYSPTVTAPPPGSNIEQFPICHVGGGTFAGIFGQSKERLEKGMGLLRSKHGIPPPPQKSESKIAQEYQKAIRTPTDIWEHLPTLKKYAEQCDSIIEFGVRDVVSTWAFLSGRPKKMACYDLVRSNNIDYAIQAAKEENIDLAFRVGNTLEITIEETDLLFIDTQHTYKQLLSELTLHAPRVKKYIVMHDTSTYGFCGQAGDGTTVQFEMFSKGLRHAVDDFLSAHPEWGMKEIFENCHGLMILERKHLAPETKQKKPAYSIVIPTFNHLDDCLRPCLESIIASTDMSEVEVIVVANGCTDGTREYVQGLGEPFKLIWMDDAQGYVKPTNAGIRASTGEYVILLNNDVVFLPQRRNCWIDMLRKPFEDPKMGATGPLLVTDAYINSSVLMFFCVMIKREVIEAVGELDELFSPGGCEDLDFMMRIQEKGFRIAQVPDNNVVENGAVLTGSGFPVNVNTGGFPICHEGSATFRHIPEYRSEIVRKNGLIVLKRYNKDLRLNLKPTVDLGKSYVRVGSKDSPADLVMDLWDLDLADNSVSEIRAFDVLDRIPFDKKTLALRQWMRVLKTGGNLFMDSREYRNKTITKDAPKKPKFSIIIPTFNHLDDCLRPCIESIIAHTNMSDVEVIVVANGCTDGTREYVTGLGSPFHLEWRDEPLGYSKPLNIGIKKARGEYLVFMNNDTALLPQKKGEWLSLLLEPFLSDSKMAAAGPLSFFDRHSNHRALISFCMIVKKSVFDAIGLFDEEYGMGGGEDVDFIIRAENAGYTWTQVPMAKPVSREGFMSMGSFPIYHKSGVSHGDIAKVTGNQNALLSSRNGLRNMKKYNKNIRLTFDLNADLSDVDHPCPLTVGLNGSNIAIIMDPLNLDFDDGSIAEINAYTVLDKVSGPKANSIIVSWLNKLTTDGRLLILSSKHGWVTLSKHDIGRVPNLGIPLPDGWFFEPDVEIYRRLAQNLPNNASMAEIGAWKGRSLCSIADILIAKNAKVLAVDTFAGSDSAPELQEFVKTADVEQIFLNNIAEFGLKERTKILKMPSDKAPAMVDSRSLDMVFIDADHEYSAIRADILAWLPKIKDRGIILGHDYMTSPDVARAVKEVFGDRVQSYFNIWFVKNESGRKVYDCFPFFNELDLLEVRLNELDSCVDYFVLAEMKVTHAGHAKPLYFQENRERFKKFWHKIIHVVVPIRPDMTESWQREQYQRSYIANALSDCRDNDIIISSDLDEIPSHQAIMSYSVEMGPMSLEQTLHYYKFNCKSNSVWHRAKIFPYKHLVSQDINSIRLDDSFQSIKNGGWHFSFMGDASSIVNKIEAFAHREMDLPSNKNVGAIERKIKNGEDLFGRSQFAFRYEKIDASYPSFVVANEQKYAAAGLIQSMPNDKMTAKFLSECEDKARRGVSSIDYGVVCIRGMSSKHIRHLINNLASVGNINYLEVGCWMGSTACAAVCGNNVKEAILIDNFSQFLDFSEEHPRDSLKANLNRYGAKYRLIEDDFFSIDVGSLPPIDMYMYDGNHSYGDHRKALSFMLPALSDTFMFIVDDYQWPSVTEGTQDAIKALIESGDIVKVHEVFFESELPKGKKWKDGYTPDGKWWNGVYVGLFKKTGKVRPKVYDCFPFFDELDLLEARLNELDPFVDKFVLSEMPVTHAGNPKPLYFQENRDRFKKFWHKIVHVVANKYPLSPDPWTREHYQRDCLLSALKTCSENDVIILSDLDEIPRGSQIDKFKKERGIMYFEQNLYNFYINLSAGKDNLDKGVFSKITTYGEIMRRNLSMTALRYHPCSESDKIENGGWHFRWMGGADQIIKKLESWAHQEWNVPRYKDPKVIEESIANGIDFFDRKMYDFKFVEIDSSFPRFIADNQEDLTKKKLIAARPPSDRGEVAVIMPYYNEKEFLERSVRAVLDQTYKHLRLFLIDDGSVDGNKAREVLRDLARSDKRITIVEKRNGGVSSARNLAISMIKQEGRYDYVAYCDADDIWDKDHLAKQLRAIDGYDMVYSNARYIFTDGSEAFPYGFVNPGEFPGLEELMKQDFIFVSSVLQRVRCLDVGEYDSDLDAIENWDMWIRIAKAGFKIEKNPQTTITYLVKPHGALSAKGNGALYDKLRNKHRAAASVEIKPAEEVMV